MTEETISPLFFEKILIKFLFHDIDVREKILPFLDPDIFDSFETKDVIKTINKFVESRSLFPTIPEIKLEIKNKETFDCLKECLDLDVSEYNRKYILDKIEDFFKRKMLLNELVDAASKLKEESVNSLSEFPDKIREKLSFSFDSEIGLDVFSEKGKESFFEHLHQKDKIFSTNIPYVDKIIKGGFHEKTLNLFLASTGLGKSLILCSLAVNSILRNNKVLYLTLEMSENKINERIMANLMDVDINDMNKLSREQYDSKFDKISYRLKDKLIIKEYPAKSLNSNRIRNLLKELKIKKSFVPDIIYVDYLGLMVCNDVKAQGKSYELLKVISEELRSIGQEFGQPIISAVQTNRDGIGAAVIDLTDIADSIGITATADLIIGVTQTEEYKDAGKYCWIFLKNRYGINGLTVNINVDYQKMRISSDEDEEEKFNSKPKKSEKLIDKAAVDIIKNIKNEKKQKIVDVTGIEF
jgi:replicative DNA helicase